ncbi:AraC family transcriptional regulator [Terriglobus albidus]|uniref:AraC family transcriptional regulator n=1 Tax=Terriglobus albidus TaxID=1592106 RepID=UPI0021DF65DF|nr:AraC family transcriptional regulator [Terriglobus albidus]
MPAIGVIDRGSMRTFCRREEHVLGSGTVLLLNPGEIHAPAPAGESGWSFRMFYLSPSFLTALSPGNRPDVATFKRAFVQDRELANKLFHLHVALESKGQRLEFESSFASIFHDLADRYVDRKPTDLDVRADATAVDTALQYLEANCHRNLSLEELSQHSPYGVSHFTRVFQKTVGLTPHAYLLQLRVERAKSLVHSGVPLSDASGALGFVDQSHLTRHFKRIFGVTPGQYARAAQA